jgi:hypothetical protein
MPMQDRFPLGPFIVDTDGRLAPRDLDVLPAFSVLWRGRSVHARMTLADPWDGRLKLHTVLGRMPSTASADRTGARPQSFASLRAVRRGLPGAWEVRLLADHRALLEAEAEISLPITAVGLVTALTRFLLTLSPYLDLLEEGGVTGVAPSPGMANDCPG